MMGFFLINLEVEQRFYVCFTFRGIQLQLFVSQLWLSENENFVDLSLNPQQLFYT